MTRNLVASYTVENPYRTAMLLSICLAGDKGVPSEVEKTSKGFEVVADDGKVIAFERK